MPNPENQDAPFDLERLLPEERELWDEYCAADWRDAPAMAVWSFGEICTLDAYGVPDVVAEYLDQNDRENNIGQYLENVRRARQEGRS